MNAGKKLDSKKRNEIYLLSALTFKQLDGFFAVFTPFLLKCLRVVDMNDVWFADTDRLSQFLFEKKVIVFKHGQFMESIRQQYLDSVLYESIQNQLVFQDDVQQQQQPMTLSSLSELDSFSWWQHTSQVIRCISTDKQSIDLLTSSDQLRQSEASSPTIYRMARSMAIVE